MATKLKINPCLWFDFEAQDAANFYVSIFKNSAIGKITRYTEEGQELHNRPPGSVMTVEFELDGQKFLGLNGGPVFKFNEAVSFIINCDIQEEIDYYWDKLTEKGDPQAQQCGWLKDKFGVSWQVVPNIVTEIMSGSDLEAIKRVSRELFKMKKIDIKTLEEAYKGEVAGIP